MFSLKRIEKVMFIKLRNVQFRERNRKSLISDSDHELYFNTLVLLVRMCSM